MQFTFYFGEIYNTNKTREWTRAQIIFKRVETGYGGSWGFDSH